MKMNLLSKPRICVLIGVANVGIVFAASWLNSFKQREKFRHSNYKQTSMCTLRYISRRNRQSFRLMEIRLYYGMPSIAEKTLDAIRVEL